MTVRAKVSKHEQCGCPFDTLGRTEFWMHMAETMIIARVMLRNDLYPHEAGDAEEMARTRSKGLGSY
jgi:hypothetical protein